MKIFLTLTSLVLLLLNFTANAAPAVVCGDSISADLTLSADLDCSGSSAFDALLVLTDNVTIDLNGHTISGRVDQSGISVLAASNVSIKNGMIRDVQFGINTSDSPGLTVEDLLFFKTVSGVVISSGSNGLIHSNQFIKTSGYAISIANYIPGQNSQNNVISENEIYQGSGISLCGSGTSDNLIRKNFIWKAEYGMLLSDTQDNIIVDNEILETSEYGVILRNSSSNVLTGNDLQTGGQAGLWIDSKNYAAGCLDSGSRSSAHNRFESNYSRKYPMGVLVSGQPGASSFKNTIRNNKLYDNTTGIYFTGDTLYNNAKSNGYQGTLNPVIDLGTGNAY